MTAESSTPAPQELTGSTARASYAHALPVLSRLREAGHQAVLVGGGIRDLFLGRPVRDWDVATSAPPEEVLALWPDAVPTGIRHGTVTILGSEPVEVTTYRGDGPYSDGRHPDWVRFDVDLQADLARRDFTINAMAFDPEENRLFDPFGGRDDLARGCLRTVGDPDLRFSEDGLRPLRGIRLAAALELKVDPETLSAMSRSRPQVEGVARERVRDELLKLLQAPRPSLGIELLRTCGLLEEVLPELLEGYGVAQNRYHAHDVYRHALHTLDAVPAENLPVRLAALLHDIGKPRSKQIVDGEGTFHGHERVGASMAADLLDRLRFPRDDRDHVVQLIREHMFHYTPEWKDASIRRFLNRVGPETLPDLFALRRADDEGAGTGKNSDRSLAELQARIDGVLQRQEALSIGDLAVGGRDLMEDLGIATGPRVGEILHTLLDRVLEDPSVNRREILLKLAREIGRSS